MILYDPMQAIEFLSATILLASLFIQKINLKLNGVCWHSERLTLTSLLWIEILDILRENHHHRIRDWEMENSMEIFILFNFMIEMRLKFTNHYKLLSCPLEEEKKKLFDAVVKLVWGLLLCSRYNSMSIKSRAENLI